MKKIIIYFMLLVVSATSFSQSIIARQPLISEDYLVISKNQQTAAWILLGSGAAIAAIGGIIQLNHENKRAGGFDFDFTGAIIAIAGGVVCLSSVPFFIASAKNKRKGIAITFKNVPAYQIKNSSLVYQPMTAVCFKINL